MDIAQLKRDQDEIDSAIVLLFKKRMGVAKKIASLKKSQGLGSYDEAHEQEVLSLVSEMAGADYADGTQALYKEIITLSHSYLQNA